jgi:hypothetical protein
MLQSPCQIAVIPDTPVRLAGAEPHCKERVTGRKLRARCPRRILWQTTPVCEGRHDCDPP